MSRKNKLLSIGDISKFTGASHRSLRYYEQIGLLAPQFIDPDSSYRYYSFDQVYLVDIIQFCIELDVPLKVLKEYIDAKGTVDTVALLSYARQAAVERQKRLEIGLRFIDSMEQEIALAEQYQNGQIYTREIAEQAFCVMPCGQPYAEIDPQEATKTFWGLAYSMNTEEPSWKFGLLSESTPQGISRYVFMELQRCTEAANVKTIPAGIYFCKQSDASMIEQAADIFQEQLQGNPSFLAIETEIFAGKHQISKPINELRVIAL